MSRPAQAELTPEHFQTIHDTYYGMLMEQDEVTRQRGFSDNSPAPSFDDALDLHEAVTADMVLVSRGTSKERMKFRIPALAG